MFVMAMSGNAVLAPCPSPELDFWHRGHSADPTCPPPWAARSAPAAKGPRARGCFQADHSLQIKTTGRALRLGRAMHISLQGLLLDLEKYISEVVLRSVVSYIGSPWRALLYLEF